MKAICLTLGICLLPVPALATCHKGPFEAFFREFARDIAVQEATAQDVVTVSRMDHDAQPEPVAVEQKVPRADLEWPVVPNLTQFERAGGSVRYAAANVGQSVTLTGDSGYLITLFFSQDPCWRLEAIRDESM